MRPRLSPKPKTHAKGCTCPLCNRTARAATAVALMREAALQKARTVRTANVEAEHATKREAARAALEVEERATAAAVADLHDAKARADADPQAARLRELRAEGKTLAQAIEIIEAEDAG